MARMLCRECPHCGHILASLTRSYGMRHVNKCKASHPAERKYFKQKGHWPKKNSYPKWVREEMAEKEQKND